ncbi:MAG: LPS export ABC transporter permease LptG [Janthinobacterium lividum]
MKVYERYFARQIYLTFVFVLFAFSALFFFFDLLSELDSVGQGHYGFGLAVLRVLLQTPSRFYEIIPVAALIAAIYVFAMMAANSEYTIFRVSGLSPQRALWSLIKLGAPLVALTFLFGEVIGPYTDQFSERVRLEALGSSVSSDFHSGVWVKDSDNNTAGQPITRFINVGELLPDATIRNVRIYEFDQELRLETIRVAASGVFHAPHSWLLSGVTGMNLTRSPAVNNDPLGATYKSSVANTSEYSMRSELTPQILSVLLVSPERMSIYNLFSYINHLRENSQDAQRYQIALWRKILYPFAVLVMMVLSLPFAYLHSRAGMVGAKVLGGIMLGMSFQLINTLFSHIGTLNTWPAPLTAATPALIYLALALVGLRWVDRH